MVSMRLIIGTGCFVRTTVGYSASVLAASLMGSHLFMDRTKLGHTPDLQICIQISRYICVPEC